MIVRDWTDRDVAKLRELAASGITSAQAAKQLRRSPGALRFKAMRLGVSFFSMGKTHSRKQKARYA